MMSVEERQVAIRQSMLQVDEEIVRKLFPKGAEIFGRCEYNAHIWLKAHVEMLLMECDDMTDMGSKIVSIICKSPYSDIILNGYVDISEIMNACKIHKDFETAFKNIGDANKVANLISYGLSKSDLKNLAILHKKGVCRDEVEELLTACNFHCESERMRQGRYETFIPDSLVGLTNEQYEMLGSMKEALIHLKAAWSECLGIFLDCRVECNQYILGDEEEGTAYPFTQSFDEINVIDWVDGCVSAIDRDIKAFSETPPVD